MPKIQTFFPVLKFVFILVSKPMITDDANDLDIESLLRLFVLRAGPQIASFTMKQKLEIRKLLGYLDS